MTSGAFDPVSIRGAASVAQGMGNAASQALNALSPKDHAPVLAKPQTLSGDAATIPTLLDIPDMVVNLGDLPKNADAGLYNKLTTALSGFYSSVTSTISAVTTSLGALTTPATKWAGRAMLLAGLVGLGLVFAGVAVTLPVVGPLTATLCVGVALNGLYFALLAKGWESQHALDAQRNELKTASESLDKKSTELNKKWDELTAKKASLEKEQKSLIDAAKEHLKNAHSTYSDALAKLRPSMAPEDVIVDIDDANTALLLSDFQETAEHLLDSVASLRGEVLAVKGSQSLPHTPLSALDSPLPPDLSLPAPRPETLARDLEQAFAATKLDAEISIPETPTKVEYEELRRTILKRNSGWLPSETALWSSFAKWTGRALVVGAAIGLGLLFGHVVIFGLAAMTFLSIMVFGLYFVDAGYNLQQQDEWLGELDTFEKRKLVHLKNQMRLEKMKGEYGEKLTGLTSEKAQERLLHQRIDKLDLEIRTLKTQIGRASSSLPPKASAEKKLLGDLTDALGALNKSLEEAHKASKKLSEQQK